MSNPQSINSLSTQQTTPAPGASSHSLYLLLILSILLATTILRTIHLDADPVPWFTEELGYQIDEGYKTLSPRNLYLYGTTHWNPADQYRGWMKASAITQWPYYLSFKLLGAKLSSARAVSIIYAITFLVFAAVFLWGRTTPRIAAVGVLLLASDPALFLFSRSALFETSLTLFTYTGIFLSAALSTRYRRASFIPIIILAIPAMLYLKMSAIIYMAPPALCFMMISLRDKFHPAVTSKGVVSALVLLVVISATVYLKQEYLLKTFNLQGIISKPQTLFLNPIHTLSPLALILAYTVLLELLIRQPKAILNDGYRLALASLVVFAPIALAFFAYHPARYYLPIVPAALLIVVERFTLNIPRNPDNQLAWLSPNTFLAAITLLALTMTLMASVNYYILSNLPINIGGDPGLSDPALLKLFPLFLVLFTVFAVVIAKRYWSDISTGFYTSLTGFHVIIGLGILIAALAYPTYQARQIRELLSHQVKQDESIGGDWAPLFVADTNLHALYMRPDFNSAEIVRDIRPDYFLHSDTPYDQKTFAGLKLIQDIKLGEPIELGTYAGHNIALHSIDYLELDAPGENNLRKPSE